MNEKEYLEKNVFSEHSRFMERFLAKMDEDRRLAEIRLEREQERLKEERKEAEARLLAEERRLSEERKIAEERLKEERKSSRWMFIGLVITIGLGFLTVLLTALQS